MISQEFSNGNELLSHHNKVPAITKLFNLPWFKTRLSSIWNLLSLTGFLKAVQWFLSHKQNLVYINSTYMQTTYLLFFFSSFFFLNSSSLRFFSISSYFSFLTQTWCKSPDPLSASIPLGLTCHSVSVLSQKIFLLINSAVTLHLLQFNYIFLGGKRLKICIAEYIWKPSSRPEFRVEFPEALVTPALNHHMSLSLSINYVSNVNTTEQCDYFNQGLTNVLQYN